MNFSFPNDCNKIGSYSIILISFILIITTGCITNHNSDQSEAESEDEIIHIVTNVMDFVMVDTLIAGWHTFQYENKSNEPHFFLVGKYPDGKTIEDGKKEIIPHFQNGMNKIMNGKWEEAGAEFAKLPEWYGKVQFCGGSGIISPGGTSITTLKLDPGYYVFECYMKMKGGIFHSAMGMLTDLVVLDNKEEIGEAPVSPDFKLSISSTEGFVFSDTIHGGEVTFEVKFIDQIVHENFVGHDVNLAKVEESANLDDLEEWMNWSAPTGLLEQPPGGITFLGGVNDMSTGEVGYFTAKLNAGSKYVLISEVPRSKEKNLLKTFIVSE